jgi:translation initiation factor 2B subunit (eIF-2B alpha/beta/delta family)
MSTAEWTDRAARIADDRDAGASEILARLLPLLEEARAAAPGALAAMAGAVRAAQPAMAGLWWACVAAQDDLTHPGRLAQAAAQARRAPAALTRVAVDAFRQQAPSPPWQLVTWSYSSAVAAFLEALATCGAVQVTCAEGRPRYEGRRLALRLSAVGVAVTLATDAAASAMLSGRSAVVVGADAVTAEGWINKVGTGALAAAARTAGVPVMVLASREKFVDAPGFAEGALRVSGEADEVWTPSDSAIRIENPTFELVPLMLADLLLTDRDAISPDQLRGPTPVA